MAGLDSTGLDVKRLNDIIADLQSRTKASFGSSVNVEEDSVFGQLYGVISPELLSLWELAQGVYDGFIPASAEFTQLDGVASIVGVNRIAAASSSVTIHVVGDAGVLIPSSSLISVDGTGDQFQTLSAKTLSLASAVRLDLSVSTVLDSTPYTVTINGIAHTYVSGVGATAISVAAGIVNEINLGSEPVAATDNLDGTFYFEADDVFTTFITLLSAGLTTLKITDLINTESVDTGRIVAPANTLTQIDTPVFGWDSVTNPVAAILGRDEETDTALRLRRNRSLQISGTATAGAIRSQVAQLDGVSSASIVENDTDSIVDGRPPHSFEVLVIGGSNDEVAQTIFNAKPAGIETVGSLSVVVQDSQGVNVISKFSRPTDIWMHINVDYTKHSEEDFPANGENEITSAILAYGETLSIGNDVIPQRFIGPIYITVPGIESLTVSIAVSPTEVGAPGAFSTSPLPIASDEIPNFNSSRISVTEV